MPTRRQRSCLGFAIANHRRHNQVGVIECCSKGMRQGISEFASIMNAARCLWSDVTGNAPRKAKLCKQLLHSRFVFSDVWVHLGVCPFEVGVGDQ